MQSITPDAKCQVTVGSEAYWPEEDPMGRLFPVCEHMWGMGGMNRLDMFEQACKDKASTSCFLFILFSF